MKKRPMRSRTISSEGRTWGSMKDAGEDMLTFGDVETLNEGRSNCPPVVEGEGSVGNGLGFDMTLGTEVESCWVEIPIPPEREFEDICPRWLGGGGGYIPCGLDWSKGSERGVWFWSKANDGPLMGIWERRASYSASRDS